MMADFRALCAELLDWAEVTAAHYIQLPAVMLRARAALAEEPAGREPVAVTGQPSDEELALIYHDCCRGCEFMDQGGFENAARAVLARWGNPAPVPPAEGEVAELEVWLRETGDLACQADAEEGQRYWSAADLLQQRHPEPVPVSERLPGPEDCAPWPQPSDNSGWCWMSRTIHGFYGSFAIWEQVSVVPTCREVYTHWLPAHALPLPGQETK